jgi:hypothetical protein
MTTTTKRRAICIGINNFGPGNEDLSLSGCVNDARDWAAAFTARDFDSVTLIEDASATRARILSSLHASITDLSPRDTLVITFSGHGTYVPDTSGDEPDQRDEAIVTYGLELIIDDDLEALFTERARGTRVIFLSDSCHSGTINRALPALAPETIPPAAGQNRIRFIPPQELIERGVLQIPAVPANLTPRSTTPPRRLTSSAPSLSGCKDTEYSYDAWFEGRANGAFTYAALKALGTTPTPVTLASLYRATRQLLPSRDYPQSPQLQATRSQKDWTL